MAEARLEGAEGPSPPAWAPKGKGPPRAPLEKKPSWQLRSATSQSKVALAIEVGESYEEHAEAVRRLLAQRAGTFSCHGVEPTGGGDAEGQAKINQDRACICYPFAVLDDEPPTVLAAAGVTAASPTADSSDAASAVHNGHGTAMTTAEATVTEERPGRSFFCVLDGHGKQGAPVADALIHALYQLVEHELLTLPRVALPPPAHAPMAAGVGVGTDAAGETELVRWDALPATEPAGLVGGGGAEDDGYGRGASGDDAAEMDAYGRALSRSFARAQALLGERVLLAELAQHAGACACAAVLEGGALWVANAGDCRAVLARRKGCAAAAGPRPTTDRDGDADADAAAGDAGGGGALRALELTRDHSAGLPSERARIEASGGFVSDGVDDDDEFEPPRVYVDLSRRYVGPGLAISRSLGDLAATSVGVSPMPEVTRVRHGAPGSRSVCHATNATWDGDVHSG